MPQRNGTYQYVGLPLTPAIAAELAVELFSGRTLKRQQIVDAVRDEHALRGGADASALDLARVIKKGLSMLKDRGLCSNPSTGYWRINSSTAETIPQASPSSDDDEFSKAPILPIPLRTVGSGCGSVYVYYFPIYKRSAETEGKLCWPCKIGRSDRDPILRVLSQSGTALPEKPEIAILVKSDQPALLESALHSVLKLRSKWRQNSPGSEWFDTNPDEVMELLSFFTNES